LTIEQILRWADNHQGTHQCWPNRFSGRVAEAPWETWNRIDNCLRQGKRGLPGCSSLGALLAQHRQVRKRVMNTDVTVERILSWADAHHAATGEWPTTRSGPVRGASGRDWALVDEALRKGVCGLPAGSSLGRLLNERGRARQRELTVETILAWANAHHAITGRWPNRHSGAVRGEPGEKWLSIDQALMGGHRGLPAGSSLAKLLANRKALGPVYRRADD
jgi:hypothetical protein